LLHWSTRPSADGSNPEPEMVTTDPPLRQVPGVTVIVAAPFVAVVGAAVQGCVDGVVVVGGAVVDVVVVVVVVGCGLAPAAVAKVSSPASPATTAMDPMSPTRTSFLIRRILTPRAFRPYE
jgi:hypothetical protein